MTSDELDDGRTADPTVTWGNPPGRGRIRRLRPKQVGIVPRSGLYLYEHEPELDARFAGIFRETWARVALAERRRVLAHWRKDIVGFGGEPMIALTGYLPDRKNGKGLAICANNGHKLLFYGPLVAKLPDRHVAELVAHELAHVVIATYPQFRGTPPGDEEVEADVLMNRWGFDPVAMDVWFQQHIHAVTRRGVRWRRRPLSRKRAEALVVPPARVD